MPGTAPTTAPATVAPAPSATSAGASRPHVRAEGGTGTSRDGAGGPSSAATVCATRKPANSTVTGPPRDAPGPPGAPVAAPVAATGPVAATARAASRPAAPAGVGPAANPSHATTGRR